MLQPNEFVDALTAEDMTFFAGVPDSLLRPVLAYVQDHVPVAQHVICANEGNAIALATGYHLGTRRVPVVYMQNSGLGNAVNPLVSLTDRQVYAVPMLLLIGWRGEPGIKDQPQHVKQGAVTRELLDTLGVGYHVLAAAPREAVAQIADVADKIRRSSTPCALLIRDGTFDNYTLRRTVGSTSTLCRERAIQCILEVGACGEDALVLSTTGRISCEVYEIRVGQGITGGDFLNIGSMGHVGSIALGVALAHPRRRVFCLDGDGSLLMHMGSMAVIGQSEARNLVHVVLNNGAHESVGGQPTVAGRIDIPRIAAACGYARCMVAHDEAQLRSCLEELTTIQGPVLLEVRVALGSRADLGRPRSTPFENKRAFLEKVHGRAGPGV